MNEALIKDAILRIGEVIEINGRTVYVLVDKNKNSSDLLFDGKILKNISVGSYIEIRKGFLSIIGKVDGEKLEDDPYFKKRETTNQYQRIDRNKRVLTVRLSGYIPPNGQFVGGIKELPLLGNESYILTEEKIHKIHNLLKGSSAHFMNVAVTDTEEIPIDLPIDGIFNSHIAIFGNTGSGKSNTLAALYQGLFNALDGESAFKQSCKFLLFDFNGEYTGEHCITKNKTIINLSTRTGRNKIPISFNQLIDIETMSILLEATEKTQKPFLKRTLRYYKDVRNKSDDEYFNHFQNILKKKIKDALQMSNKEVAYRILDYIEEILALLIDQETITPDDKRAKKDELRSDIEFHSGTSFTFKRRGGEYFNATPEDIKNTNMHLYVKKTTSDLLKSLSELQQFYIFLHLQLIGDLHRYKVQSDHVYPVINRFKAKQQSIERTFGIENDPDIWSDNNLVVINLRDVNLDMRKTIPLLLAKNIYNIHKGKDKNDRGTLNIIVDEAHNILSKTSFRETEEWKDYRLETFEEIIKEGRKFGVFMTIASQRPNDISATIISQAHNYFIHQLINQNDLLTIGNAVSYIDKITEESIPTLSVGVCVFSVGIKSPKNLSLRYQSEYAYLVVWRRPCL